MIRRFATGMAGLTLVACASAPKGGPAPTYFERVRATPAADARGACQDPDSSTTDHHELVPRANACVKAKDFARVEAYGQALATRAMSTPWGPYYLALAAHERGDYARARWMINRALERAPDQALFHFELARLNWSTRDDLGVAKEMARAADLAPELTDAHLVQGELALRREDFATAKLEFAKALAVDPAFAPALLGLAEVTLRQKDYVAAEDALKRAVAAAPRVTRARLELARIQETQLKKPADALDTLKAVRRLASERKLDQPTDVNQRIQSLEKTVSQAKADQDKSRMPSAERK